jgi:transposase
MKPVEIDEDRLIDLYVNQELTAKDCAKALGVGDAAVRRRLRKLGISVRPSTRRLIADIADEQVIDLYCNQKLSLEQTAERLGRSRGFVRGRLKKSGIVSRSLSDSARKRRGTSDITDDQLIYLHDVRGWSCAKISKHFNKSPDFVRQRFIVIGKTRRDKVGKNNPAYIDGRTPLRTRIRDCAKSLSWKQACMERDNYTCTSTGQHGGKLEVHHLKPFSQIFEEFLLLNSDLHPDKDCDELFELSQYYDPFWDMGNGVTLSEEAHHAIHTT